MLGSVIHLHPLCIGRLSGDRHSARRASFRRCATFWFLRPGYVSSALLLKSSSRRLKAFQISLQGNVREERCDLRRRRDAFPSLAAALDELRRPAQGRRMSTAVTSEEWTRYLLGRRSRRHCLRLWRILRGCLNAACAWTGENRVESTNSSDSSYLYRAIKDAHGCASVVNN